MSRKVRKTLNIDAAKLKRAKQYLGLDTETAVQHAFAELGLPAQAEKIGA